MKKVPSSNQNLIHFRSVVTECVQKSRVGHSAHIAGDVQLPSASHTAALPRTTAQSSALTRPRPANQSESTTLVVTMVSRQAVYLDSLIKRNPL